RRNPFGILPEGDFPGRAAVHVFIVKLDADYRAAVFEQQPLKLPSHRLIKAPHASQVALVVGADGEGTAIQPVRETAVAAFAMGKRANPHQSLQAARAAEFDKTAQVVIARPIENTLFLFDMNPEDIGGNNIHTAGPDFQQFLFPELVWKTGKVELSH